MSQTTLQPSGWNVLTAETIDGILKEIEGTEKLGPHNSAESVSYPVTESDVAHSLSYVMGSRFIERFKSQIENPESLLVPLERMVQIPANEMRGAKPYLVFELKVTPATNGNFFTGEMYHVYNGKQESIVHFPMIQSSKFIQ